MQPTIDIINLDTEELVRTDSVTIAGATIIGKITWGKTPVSSRTWEKAWKIILVQDTGEMLKPLNTNGEYFDTEYQVWDDRGSYTYA